MTRTKADHRCLDAIDEPEALDELDDLDELRPEDEPEWGLPYRAGSFRDGVPQVTVDYFELEGDREVIAGLLGGIRRVIEQHGGPPRFYFFGRDAVEGVLDPRKIIGIATFRGGRLRVETNMPGHTQSVRARVQRALGKRVRHVARDVENPIDEYLDRPHEDALGRL